MSSFTPSKDLWLSNFGSQIHSVSYAIFKKIAVDSILSSYPSQQKVKEVDDEDDDDDDKPLVEDEEDSIMSKTNVTQALKYTFLEPLRQEIKMMRDKYKTSGISELRGAIAESPDVSYRYYKAFLARFYTSTSSSAPSSSLSSSMNSHPFTRAFNNAKVNLFHIIKPSTTLPSTLPMTPLQAQATTQTPTTQTQTQTQTPAQKTNKISNLQTNKWFHGSITRSTAETLCMKLEVGAYLLRFVESASDDDSQEDAGGGFTLAYKSQDGSVKHVRIFNVSGGFSICSSSRSSSRSSSSSSQGTTKTSKSKNKGREKDEEKTFRTLSKLIDFQKKKLKMPVLGDLYHKCLNERLTLVREDGLRAALLIRRGSSGLNSNLNLGLNSLNSDGSDTDTAAVELNSSSISDDIDLTTIGGEGEKEGIKNPSSDNTALSSRRESCTQSTPTVLPILFTNVKSFCGSNVTSFSSSSPRALNLNLKKEEFDPKTGTESEFESEFESQQPGYAVMNSNFNSKNDTKNNNNLSDWVYTLDNDTNNSNSNRNSNSTNISNNSNSTVTTHHNQRQRQPQQEMHSTYIEYMHDATSDESYHETESIGVGMYSSVLDERRKSVDSVPEEDRESYVDGYAECGGAGRYASFDCSSQEPEQRTPIKEARLSYEVLDKVKRMLLETDANSAITYLTSHLPTLPITNKILTSLIEVDQHVEIDGIELVVVALRLLGDLFVASLSTNTNTENDGNPNIKGVDDDDNEVLNKAYEVYLNAYVICKRGCMETSVFAELEVLYTANAIDNTSRNRNKSGAILNSNSNKSKFSFADCKLDILTVILGVCSRQRNTLKFSKIATTRMRCIADITERRSFAKQIVGALKLSSNVCLSKYLSSSYGNDIFTKGVELISKYKLLLSSDDNKKHPSHSSHLSLLNKAINAFKRAVLWSRLHSHFTLEARALANIGTALCFTATETETSVGSEHSGNNANKKAAEYYLASLRVFRIFAHPSLNSDSTTPEKNESKRKALLGLEKKVIHALSLLLTKLKLYNHAKVFTQILVSLCVDKKNKMVLIERIRDIDDLEKRNGSAKWCGGDNSDDHDDDDEPEADEEVKIEGDEENDDEDLPMVMPSWSRG